MSLPRVVAVASGSPAARAGLQPGDEILAMDGQLPRDIIQYQLLADQAELEFELRRGGLERLATVRRDTNEPLGIEVDSALFDRVRTCDNHCEFCFIHQLPKGMRKSLYTRDDDYRLSFLYGNFTTLTRFTEADLERVVTEGLSPLWVSIHATDPEVRARMLRNRRGATSLRWLRALLDHGIEVHGQVVVCPGVNDGEILDDTLAGVLDRYPELASVACVPLGVSRFNVESAMRPSSPGEAAAVVDLIEGWQPVFTQALGRPVVFAADEYYLVAGRPFPSLESYGSVAQHDNGVGMVASFDARFHGRNDAPAGGPGGFFQSVDGAPAAGYRAPRCGSGTAVTLSPRRDAAVTVLTGRYGAQVLAPLVAAVRPDATILPVDNDFFGGNIAVAGLMTGADVARTLSGRPSGRAVPAAGRVLVGGKISRRAGARGPARGRRGRGCGRRRAAARPGAGEGVVSLSSRPLVAVVGRPNVGKSTLVNRVVGRREAIVEERPGVTRDRKPLDAEWAGREFTIVDTGGWLAAGDTLDQQVSAQAERAIREAVAVLLVVDASVGVTEEDARVATLLRKTGRPTLVVANKVDGDSRDADAWTFARLGLGDPWPVSSLHGRGTGDLLDAVVALLPAVAAPDDGADGDSEEDVVASVAIVGRPNVGKSTLFNRLIGDERSVVHDLPGTTRDSIDTLVSTPEGNLRFIDTAGMRRRAKEAEGAEYYSLVRALQAIDRANAALLVIDATAGVTRQDQRLAERMDAAGSPIVIMVNKWELLDAETRAKVTAEVEDELAFLGYAPVLKVSALTGLGVHKLYPALQAAIEAYHRRVPTAELNRVLAQAQAAHHSPGGRVLYATQGATDPPTFTLFTTKSLPAPYLRYLERRIREHFGFGPTPIKFRVRRRAS